MLKRIFWLALLSAIGWLVWRRFQGRAEFTSAPPQPTTLTRLPIIPSREPDEPQPPEPPSLLVEAAPPTVIDPAIATDEPAVDIGTTHESSHPGISRETTATPQAAKAPERAAAPAAPEPPAQAVEVDEAAQAPAEVDALVELGRERAVGEAEQLFADETSHADSDEDELEGVAGYCLRCKEKRIIAHAHEEITENGRRSARGTCPVCGARMVKFLPQDGDDDERSEA